MIVVKQKHIDEILRHGHAHRRVLLVGCDTCAAVSLAGGEKEVATLAEPLQAGDVRAGSTVEFSGTVFKRQCEPEFTEELETGGVRRRSSRWDAARV